MKNLPKTFFQKFILKKFDILKKPSIFVGQSEHITISPNTNPFFYTQVSN